MTRQRATSSQLIKQYFQCFNIWKIALLSTVNLFVRHKNQRKLWFWIVNEVHKMCQRTHQQLFVRRRPLDYGRMIRRYNRLFVFVAKRNWCSSIPIMLYMILLVSSLGVHFHQIFDLITKLFCANINLYIIIGRYEISIMFIYMYLICQMFMNVSIIFCQFSLTFSDNEILFMLVMQHTNAKLMYRSRYI